MRFWNLPSSGHENRGERFFRVVGHAPWHAAGCMQRTGAVEETVQPTRRHRKQVVPATHRRLPAHAFRGSSAQTLSTREERACRPIFEPRFTTGSAMNDRERTIRDLFTAENCIERPFLAIT